MLCNRQHFTDVVPQTFAPQEVATCLRLLRQHEAVSRLAQGVGEPLLQLVVARLGSCPSEVASFGSILDALGRQLWSLRDNLNQAFVTDSDFAWGAPG